MKFLVIVKASKSCEAGVPPGAALVDAMVKYNEELVKAGIMVSCEGLHPSAEGARVRISGSKRTVTDGPFAETKELAAGFWIWNCKSKAEAMEWLKRCPNTHADGGEFEIRQIRAPEDFVLATR